MGRERIVYQDWIVELGRDPATIGQVPPPAQRCDSVPIITAVNQALHALEAEEAFFIRSFYMQGMGYREISRLTGRAIYRLEALHAGAVKKLKRRLYALLGGRYRIPAPPQPECPLCRHPRAEAIDRLIRAKSPEETWRRIIRELRHDYGIVIDTPQRLIGHRKYHMT